MDGTEFYTNNIPSSPVLRFQSKTEDLDIFF